MFHKIHYTLQKLESRLKLIEPLVYGRSEQLQPFRYKFMSSHELPPDVAPDFDDSAWTVLYPGTYWGEWMGNFVLRTVFTIPDGWDPAATFLYLPIGDSGDFSHPESLLYIDGQPYATVDRHHNEVLLPPALHDGKQHSLALHGWIGLLEGDVLRRPMMRLCQLVEVHAPTRQFVARSRVALGVVRSLPVENPARGGLLTALDEAYQVLDTREPLGDRFYASVGTADRVLQAGIERSGPPMPVDVTAVGHAHIDVAWLWTLGMTHHKTARTFHTVLRLMEQYPDYLFTQSQPALYDFIRQDHPQVFEAIQARIAEGRWEPIGGMWVEADCNLTGAEALARQFLLGEGFFKEYFGENAASPVLWLPDVFGYNWNLPQLITEAGLKYFFTIKIGWSQYNRLPFDSFWWQGLDGTRVLTHFSTTNDGSEFASTYNAMASPEQTMNTWTNFQQKDAGRPGEVPPLLMSYGYGDGGGGPTREMIENVALLGNFPATPRLRYGKAGEFYRRLEEEQGDRLPVWNGELYLEYHRGTYTTQARTKRANRKSEFALHDAEFLAAAASLRGYDYPTGTLRELWKVVATNQFHDILPGSSIGPVYEEALQHHAGVQQGAHEVLDGAWQELAGDTQGITLVNPAPFARREVVMIPSDMLPEGKLQGQAVEGGLLVDSGELPPYSFTPSGEALQGGRRLVVSQQLLENDFVRVEFNADGDIISIFDKAAQREVLPEGGLANQFQAFEDRPMNFDAWDIDIYFEDKRWLAEPAESIRVVEHGPLRATIEIQRRILNSVYTQRISLAYNSPRVDFSTRINWMERHVLLKVAFPVNVLTTRATYEIQWGNVERNTHANTSWDWARFEVVGHKWVDASEGDYGVSLFNDCKYGHDIRNAPDGSVVMRLSLLRSPTMPDPAADLGEHEFSYAILPHTGGWDERTVAQAYAFNDPVIVLPGNVSLPSLVQADRSNVVIETIKGAEDGRGIIVRLYECQRKRGPFTLTTAFPIAQAWDSSLIEQDRNLLAVDGNQIHLNIRPYQIMTVRIIPAQGAA